MRIRCAFLWAFSAVSLGALASVQAAQTPVFQYSFPASWNGTGTTVTDQSAAGNNAATVATPVLSAAVPPGAPGGTQSVTTNAGAILTNATGLLNNSIVAAYGGYQYDVDFMWDGTDSASFGHTEKIIDYAGTESLQLTTSAGSAALQFRFDDSNNAVSTTILPNIWYHAVAEFDSNGNAVDGSGNLAGTAMITLTDLTDSGSPITFGPFAATKTAQGDTLTREIGVGQLGANFGYLVGFKGDIYNPAVSLVPEPASLGLLCAAIPLLYRRRRAAQA
jgi:hypothetical protein